MGFIVKERNVLLAERDAYKLAKRGYVTAPDYVSKRVLVVSEVDSRTLQTRPLGFVTDKAYQPEVVKRGRTAFARSNRLVRPSDLLDLDRLTWRTGRTKATIVGTWTKWKDWPEPVMEVGRSKVWYWPDVQACMERHGLTVRKRGRR